MGPLSTKAHLKPTFLLGLHFPAAESQLGVQTSAHSKELSIFRGRGGKNRSDGSYWLAAQHLHKAWWDGQEQEQKQLGYIAICNSDTTYSYLLRR